MSLTLLGAVLVMSLLGSVHCVGMCGGFVAFYSGEDTSHSAWRAHAGYHAARLVSYVSVGAAAGALGSAVDAAGSAFGLARGAALIAGLTMVGWALLLLGRELGLRLPAGNLGTKLGELATATLTPLARKPPVLRASLLGLASTLLPCGFLYAFYVTAAGTGSALGGATVMAVFWLGTVPLLLGLGASTARLARSARRHVPVLGALLLLSVGLLQVLGRLSVPASAMGTIGSALEASPTTDATPPCHRTEAPP